MRTYRKPSLEGLQARLPAGWRLLRVRHHTTPRCVYVLYGPQEYVDLPTWGYLTGVALSLFGEVYQWAR